MIGHKHYKNTLKKLAMAYYYIHRSVNLSFLIWKVSIYNRRWPMQCPILASGQRQTTAEGSELKEYINLTPSPKTWKSLLQRKWKECKSLKCWIAMKKYYLLDTIGQMSRWTHRTVAEWTTPVQAQPDQILAWGVELGTLSHPKFDLLAAISFWERKTRVFFFLFNNWLRGTMKNRYEYRIR